MTCLRQKTAAPTASPSKVVTDNPTAAAGELQMRRITPRSRLTDVSTTDAVSRKRKDAPGVKPLRDSNSLPTAVATKPKTSKSDLKKLNEIFVKPVKDKVAASEDEADAPVEKKKKRKLGVAGAKTAFVWDQSKVRASRLALLGRLLIASFPACAHRTPKGRSLCISPH